MSKIKGNFSKILFSQPHLDSISPSLISRLNIICKRRFNCTFRYYSFSEYGETPPRPLVVRTLLEKNSHVIINGSLLLSMRSDGRLFGYVEVFSDEPLKPREADQIRELLEFSIGSVVECLDHLSDIKRLENAIFMNHPPVNVLQMSSHRQLSDRLADIRAQKIGLQTSQKKCQVQSMVPVLILARSDSDIQKLALALHERANYHFFVLFKDLSPDMRFCTSDFSEMGKTTVLISDLSDLNDEAILNLTNYISSPPQSNQPRFILGIKAIHPELHAHLPGWVVNLVNKKCLFQLKINRNFEFSRDHFLLEEFDQSMYALQNPDNVPG